MQQKQLIHLEKDYSKDIIKENDYIQKLEIGITIEQLKKKIQFNELLNEYQTLMEITSSEIYLKNMIQSNHYIQKMNRYSNVLPYIHTNVKVFNFLNQNILDQNATYMNANFINTPFDKNTFIATQGPTVESIPNFWKMVWQENVGIIIMLCNIFEQNITKTEQYWPNNTFNFENELQIILLDEFYLIKQKLIQRNFQIKYKSQIRILIQLHYISWPDFGIPPLQDFKVIQKIHQKMINLYLNFVNLKMVIHCSAGIGRTGTLISIFNMILLIYQNKSDSNKISIFKEVRKLREQRFGMVQTIDQYKFIYEYLQYILKK